MSIVVSAIHPFIERSQEWGEEIGGTYTLEND
jgi:hypothetical protein